MTLSFFKWNGNSLHLLLGWDFFVLMAREILYFSQTFTGFFFYAPPHPPPKKKLGRVTLSCFDTVFQRQYRYFSIALKVVLSLSDRYNIFTSNWLWIEICENVVLSKIDITMTTINKKL